MWACWTSAERVSSAPSVLLAHTECGHGLYQRAPPPPPHHFSSDPYGWWQRFLLIVSRRTTSEDGWSRQAANTIRNRGSPTSSEPRGTGTSPSRCHQEKEKDPANEGMRMESVWVVLQHARQQQHGPGWVALCFCRLDLCLHDRDRQQQEQESSSSDSRTSHSLSWFACWITLVCTRLFSTSIWRQAWQAVAFL